MTPRVWAGEAGRGMVASVGAVVAMAGVATGALLLLDVPGDGLARQVAAVLALAVGAGLGADPGAAIEAPGAAMLAQGDIRVDVQVEGVATGVTLAGALVLAALFRHRVPRRPRHLLVRAAGTVVTFPALLAGTTYAAAAGRAATDLSASTATTVLFGLIGALGVVGVCLPFSGALRAAVTATVAVLASVALLVTVGAALFGAFGSGRAAAGMALLAGPSVLFAAVTRGIGVPWAIERSGLGGIPPDAIVHGALPGAADGAARPGALPVVDLPMWPLMVLAAVLLLGCGVLAAVRTGARPWLPCCVAAAMGPVVAAAATVMTVAATMRLDLAVSLRGLTVVDATVGLVGRVWLAAVLGLAAGTVAGTAGGLVVQAVRTAAVRWTRTTGTTDRTGRTGRTGTAGQRGI